LPFQFFSRKVATMHLSYIYALGSALTFSISTIIYTAYSEKISVLWMNTLKAVTALLGTVIFLLLTAGFQTLPVQSIFAFVSSGLIGLNIGDIFMLTAFKRIGPGRTMMLWGFQPIFMGVASYFFFGQGLSLNKLSAIAFLMACLFVISYEKYKQIGHWELRGLFYALVGVSLDATGILLSRYGFDQGPGEIQVMQGHFFRCVGAVLGFSVIGYFRPFHFFHNFIKLDRKDKSLSILGGFLGTFLALWFYLSAVKIGHLPSVAAIGVASPVFASVFESIYLGRKPTLTWLTAFVFFLVGFFILINTN
jgi:drug/metabolite transporter (DMT)-like permease